MEEVKSPVYKLKKPFDFDGIEITEIDLSCIDNVTKSDINIALNRHSARKTKIGDNYLTDPNYLYDILCLSMCQPFEYFDAIGGKDYQMLQLRVLDFLVS